MSQAPVPTAPSSRAKPQPHGRAAALAVATGILLSRLIGLIRERIFAHYFGNSTAADAFKAAFRIPNMLQNLFGEGVLSASFIPVYARLNAEKRHDEATRTAGAIFALLVLVASVLVLCGMLLTPWLIDVIAPGFHGDKRLLTIQLVRILFPGAALLVLSAWCLGVLNSHRRFLLSYAAPVVWNLAMIATLVWQGSRLIRQGLSNAAMAEPRLAVALAVGSVIGSALQFLVQMPVVLKLLSPLQFKATFHSEHVRTIVRNFFPVFVSRGVVQVSAFVDQILASLLPTGAVAALSYAQTINQLPVSLFGMAVSAAELPAMSATLGTAEEIAAKLRARLAAGLSQIAWFVVPSAVAFVLLGDVVVAAIYRSGHFRADDVIYVWSALAGSGVGLLAGTSGRLYSSTFYALRDTRTPLNFAVVRVILTLALGYLFSLPLPRLLGINPRWGVAGLTLSAGLAAWVEYALLRRSLHRRIGTVDYPASRVVRLWLGAVLASVLCYLLHRHLQIRNAQLAAAAILLPYGGLYIAFTALMKVPIPGSLMRRFRRG
ncbi:MAG: putative peptidoglycan lipid flippase [Acidobacteriaceae bacterium]|jgi:putative peptidoglycan lipid II flippase|nr:putative peptidoglycan lipid flippase [Acidobacteriaceae bacterium]